MLEYLITIGILIIASIPLIWYIRSHRKEVKKASQKLQDSIETGRTEPVSLHPYIDPNICIGTAACVPACPEGDILGIIEGRGRLVEPSNCIGHGECFRACPVEAITLVFGTEKRGVDIPHLKQNFETNVPGIHIVGELGGMGLIRNAVTQGREAIQSIAPKIREMKNGNDIPDVGIVGAGPAGLAAAAQAVEMGLSYVILDQNDIGGSILSYPRQKIVMTHPMTIPVYGQTKFKEISKEDLLALWSDIISKTNMEIHTGQHVQDVQRTNGHFTILTQRDKFEAKKVILAIGRRGTPRKLGVPGEESAKVTYHLLEAEQYAGSKCLVVGGGDSAVEAALNLSEQPDTAVTISYRRDTFSRIKKRNLARINQAIDTGNITVLWNSEVREIQPDAVTLEQENSRFTIENDYVLVFIGGVVPTGFLNKLGIEVETKYGEV